MRKVYLGLIAACLGTSAFAGGYRVSLQGVRQSAIGLTSVMHTRDASVAFFNPAGLAFVESKFSVAAGGYGVMTDFHWQNPKTQESASTDSPMGTPIYFAASYRPIKDLTVGLSVTTPFGNSVKWPDNWAGSANISEITLKSFFFQPTVAYKFNDWFSVGAGFIFATGQVNLQRTTQVAGNTIGLEIDEKDASGTGFNIGAFIKPTKKLQIGLAYRSKVDMKAEDGSASWGNVPTGIATNMPFTTTNFNASLPLVSEFLAGFSYQVSDRLLLAAEVAVHGWSAYRSLDIELYNSQGDEFNSLATKNFKDQAVYKIGGEYLATENLAVRLGYYFDQSPSVADYWSPETPSVDLHVLTGGLGYKFGENFYIDAYGQYSMGKERYVHNVQNGFEGDVKGGAVVIGLGLSYNFN